MKNIISNITYFLSRKKAHVIAGISFVGLFIILLIANIQPGTYLSGWDNLQSELYPELSIKRAFFSVWQEYQSLGHIAGLAHASDIVRAVFIWILTIILPQEWVRYFFHTLMLVVGGMGMYTLLRFWRFEKDKAFALLGGFFYMFNFGTIQLFALPFEAFSIFFAALPWEIWIALKYVTHEGKISKKLLLAFLGIQVLATPQAYVQTLFIVYIFILSFIFIGILIQKPRLKTVYRMMKAFFLILLANLFWLLPQIYFVLTSSSVAIESKINELSTLDTYLQNLNKGNLVSFIKLQGFYYDLHGANGDLLFEVWHRYLELPVISLLPYFFFAIIIYGTISKTKRNLAFLIPLGITSTLLLNATFPFSLIQNALQENSMLFQVLRAPFTKLIIPHVLFMSYFMASGSYKLYYWLKGHHKQNVVLYRSYIIVMTTLILALSFPVFQGHFFSPQMKVKIPQEYFSVMEYFRTVDPNSRIDIAPNLTLWGWYRTQWGYDGSGFLWYGIEQPIVSRNFDMWSEKSESYHWEMKTAVEAQDQVLFNNILIKYRVHYLLVDESLTSIDGVYNLIEFDQLNGILKDNEMLEQVFEEGIISVYLVRQPNPEQSFLSLASGMPVIGPKVQVTTADTAYFANGDYITTTKDAYDVYYPFLDFSTQASSTKNQWRLTEYNDTFEVSAVIPKPSRELILSTSEDFIIQLWEGDRMNEYSGKIRTSIIDDRIVVVVDKSMISDFISSGDTIEYCSEVDDTVNSISLSGNNISAYSSQGSTGCFWFANPYLDQKFGYLATIESENLYGKPFFFYIHDKTKDQSYLEDVLNTSNEYYIIAPKYDYGIGYGFTFYNNSYSNISSENELNSLRLYAFPVEEVRSISIRPKSATPRSATFSVPESVVKTGYHRFTSTVPSAKSDILILSQTYHEGWKAYQIDCKNSNLQCQISKQFPYFFGQELKDHVLVNNWANGWKLDSIANISNQQTNNQELKSIAIVFWPQYLQYLGFLILIFAVIFLLFNAKKRKALKSV
jgi:hypothetical protein